MSKEIRELLAKVEEVKAEARGLMQEDKLEDAEAKMEEVRKLQKKIELQKELEEEGEREIDTKIENRKVDDNMNENETRKVDTAAELRAIIKASMGKDITTEERALLTTGANGEGYLLPEDVRTKIHTLVRDYRSFREVLGYMPTIALSGSFPIEDFETVSELIDFTDGTDGSEANDIKFRNVSFALKQKGALIKLSNTLLSMTDNDLIDYVAKVFAKKAVITENKMAISALGTGKTVKSIADWKALKKSINIDLDEAVKYGLVIVTNQDGFDKLDSEVDSQGRPILQPDPTNPTQKRFMGYPIKVYSNSLLPTTGTTTLKAPLYYGNLEEAVKFVDNNKYAFATSAHAGFNSNSTMARVIEYVDVIQVDSSDKIYIAGTLTV
ncbi:phage major capsid protein [Clostridium sp. D2Q-11]|uniref:Phage major capsid protein n=1 Tax=Anaeromonas frigoriresistens TaxID=2683708 RepID=A0A942UXC6_9FIRM|nr:phage major capsid protein [Anaeromonas frigoriresistens]MBS4539820.1 phage major capsid protein [Anaeromonas frigoriresistens]